MTTAERLYNLLPAIHRIKDADQGYPVRDLLTLVAEQVAALEENLEQLYDDQFIETCSPWVAPYIGDLIGYRSLHGVAPNVASPRADVANTIRYRRRKGTASMLEQVAHDVTGWPAHVVEFFQLLGWTQYMNHHRPIALYGPDLRNWEKLSWRDTAFDTLAHTIDVRRISKGAPRHNIPNIGLFLWRVRGFPLSRSPAVEDPTIGGGLRFRFNPLGTDMTVFSKPDTEEEITHLAEPKNVPLPLARRWLKAHLDEYYGLGKSLLVELPGNPPQPVPRDHVTICDLSDLKDGGGNVIGWAHQPSAGTGLLAIDPVLGRMAFADAPGSTALATFHYGFTTAIGGGEYERPDQEVVTPLQVVQNGAPLQPALDAVQNSGTVEANDSGRFVETPHITVNAGKTVILRARNGARPLLVGGGDIDLNLGPEATLILDGWVITRGTLIVPDTNDTQPRHLILRDCTLVPGPRTKGGGSPPQVDDPGLVILHPFAKVRLERCITAPLHAIPGAEVTLTECVMDATEEERVAFRGPNGDPLAPGGVVTLEQCTVIGKVHTQEITLASDCIFAAALMGTGETWKAPLWADRRQQGCIRFSFVPPGSRTPHRYRCQPEEGGSQIRPHFTSLRYGDPGYCQLRQSTSGKIRRGAHDESEMGVMHDLFQPQRETNLRIRLEEYLRFGLKAGLIYAS